jgi:hypothetical protein
VHRRLLTALIVGLLLLGCGSDALEEDAGGVRYRGEVTTSVDGVPLIVTVDITLSTFETGGSAGEGMVYASYGVAGSIELTNRGDRSVTVTEDLIGVSVFEELPSDPCDVGSSFALRCLTGALITRADGDSSAPSAPLEPGQSAQFLVLEHTEDGGFALGYPQSMLDELRRAFDAGDPPDVVAVFGGALGARWAQACTGMGGDGPLLVLTGDGEVFGPSQTPVPRCSALVSTT